MRSDVNREPVAPPEQVSFSSLALFDRCPAQWAAEKLDGRRSPSGRAALVGTATHAVLERLYGDTDRTVTRSDQLVTELVDPDLQDDVRPLAATGAVCRPDADVIAVEYHGTATLAGVPFHGYIDIVAAVGDVAVVADWKTGVRPDRADWRADKIRQVILYGMLIEAAGMTVDVCEVLWLRERQIDTYRMDRHRDEVTAWMVDVWSRLVTACESGVFPEQPGPLCGWCPIVAECGPGRDTVLARMRRGKNVGPATDLFDRFLGGVPTPSGVGLEPGGIPNHSQTVGRCCDSMYLAMVSSGAPPAVPT